MAVYCSACVKDLPLWTYCCVLLFCCLLLLYCPLLLCCVLLLLYCLLFVHCVSSILYAFVCFLCRSLSFLRQFFNFFVFVSCSFSFLRHCCIIVFRSSVVLRQFSSPLFEFSVVLCVSLSVLKFLCLWQSFLLSLASLLLTAFVLPLYFVNSLRLCLLSLSFFALLRQFLNLSVFVRFSFSFLRHFCLIVFRSSTVFRQFSTSLRFFISSLISLSSSVVLCLSLVTVFYSLLLFLCVSSILYAFVCFLCRSLFFLVSSLISLSLSVVLSLSCVTSV